MSWKHSCWAALLTLASVAAGTVEAKLVEEQLGVPVEVVDGYGKQVTRSIVVTVFYDDAAAKPYPVAIINHGRDAEPQARAAMGRAKFSVISGWLTQLGFMVAVPTRIGYGVSGGEDVEDSGGCNLKNYPPAYAASAVQTLKVLEAVRSRPDAAKDRAVVIGQSFGGATSIAVAALNPTGVQATINFAGGGGGNPKTQPQSPCSPALLERLFAGYGKTARIPTLWIYTENDMYFGPRLPKEWFDAFRAAGGNGEYLRFPAVGDNGHGFFTLTPATWQPKVIEFLRASGYPSLQQP